MSVRLLRPEEKLVFENIVMPVTNTNRMWSSELLMMLYISRRQFRFARAFPSSSSTSRTGLSYSSTSTTA